MKWLLYACLLYTSTLLVEGFDKYAECYFGRGEMDAPDIDGKVFFSAEEPLEFGDEVRVKTVSYTHLDVYKRQVKGSNLTYCMLRQLRDY